MSGNRLQSVLVGLAVTAAAAFAAPAPVQADSANIRADLETIHSGTRVTDKATGETLDSDVSTFRQQYDLSLRKNLYPQLSLSGGAQYEHTDTDTSSAGGASTSGETFLRPFARMALNTPLYQAGVEYRYTEIANDFSGGDSFRQYREKFSTLLGWRPMGLPAFDFRYDRSTRGDSTGTVDTLEENWNLESNYSPVEGMQLYYDYRNEQTTNQVSGRQTTTDRHNGRIDYARGFFRNRLSLSSGYQFFFRRFAAESDETVDTEIIPTAGLSSIDDTPADGPALAVNNALVDGLLGVSAGIDIGLGGDETTLTNIGLDLGLPTTVNRLLLWVDRSLTPSVANSFTWQIYTSPDNLNTSTWTLAATVSPAPFGAFDNRFEIVFPSVTTRFIKVVVRPLSPAVPGSAGFPNIFVTELEPFARVTTADFRSERDSLDQNVNFNLTGRLSEQTSVGYDLYYRTREQERFGTLDPDESSELTNGVFLRHIFNPMFSANARVQRTEREANEVRTVDLNYGASLRADYLPTFDQILTYSSTRTETDLGTDTSQSIFLRNNLRIYQGWSAFADTGFSTEQSVSSERTDTTTLRIGTNVIPHRTVTVNLDYRWRGVDNPAIDPGGTTETDYNLQVFYVPFPALSFFGKYTLTDRESDTNSLQNFAVNWSPFSDGTVQCSLNYNETREPEQDRTSRNFGPFVKWTVSRHLSVETQYSISTSDTPDQEVDTRTFQASLSFFW